MESISYLGPKMWDIQPNDYKTIRNLDTFKIKIKKRKPELARVGYVKCKICTLIGWVFFKRIKKPELFLLNTSFFTNVMKLFSC